MKNAVITQAESDVVQKAQYDQETRHDHVMRNGGNFAHKMQG